MLVFGSVAEHIWKEADVLLPTDRGTQYESRDFKQEMGYLGITKSPTFEDIEEAREMIRTFIESYNND